MTSDNEEQILWSELQRALDARAEERWPEVLDLTGGLLDRLRPLATPTARYMLADALGVRVEALAGTGRGDEALAVADEVYALTRTSTEASMLDGAAWSRRVKVVLFANVSQTAAAQDAASQLQRLFVESQPKALDGQVGIATHAIEAAYRLMTYGCEQSAIELLQTVSAQLHQVDEASALAVVARAHAVAAVAATRVPSPEIAVREVAALAAMGEPALAEIEALMRRFERGGAAGSELAQLMIARVQLLDGVDEARAVAAAEELVERFAQADDPALRAISAQARQLLLDDS